MPRRSYYYSVYHWTRGPTSTGERAAALRGAGVNGLEFGSVSRHEPRLDDLLRGVGGSVLLHNYFPPPAAPFVFNLASADASIRERSLDLARTALRISAEISAPCYAVHAGFISDPEGFDGVSYVFPTTPPEAAREAYERFLDAIAQLLAAAAEAEVQLLVENNVCPPRLRGRLLMQLPEEFTRLYADLGPTGQRLGILLDTGHLTVTARTFGRDPQRFVAEHHQRILALHVHDNDLVEDRHWPLEVAGRAVDLARACRCARWVTLETNCGTLDEIGRQLAFARREIGEEAA